MNTIHFVTGNRGNIGKSFFSILMGYLYTCNNRPFTLFDTDPQKSDVAAIYPGITDVTFDACNEIMVNYSTEAIKVDRIYEASLKQDVIVNMASDRHKELMFWLKQNGLDQTEFLIENNIQIYFWYLSNGDNTSLQLLKTLVTDYPVFNTVLVKNQGIDHQWKEEPTGDIAKILKKLPAFELSVMPRGERDNTFTLGKSYEAYINASETSKLSQNRLQTYLNQQSAKFVQIFSFANHIPSKADAA